MKKKKHPTIKSIDAERRQLKQQMAEAQQKIAEIEKKKANLTKAKEFLDLVEDQSIEDGQHRYKPIDPEVAKILIDLEARAKSSQ